MNLLLDTQALIWFTVGDSRLSKTANDIITDRNNTNFVSTVSLWEIAIKSSLGKLKLEYP